MCSFLNKPKITRIADRFCFGLTRMFFVLVCLTSLRLSVGCLVCLVCFSLLKTVVLHMRVLKLVLLSPEAQPDAKRHQESAYVFRS